MYVRMYTHNSVILSMANTKQHGDAFLKGYELIIYVDTQFITNSFWKKYAKNNDKLA